MRSHFENLWSAASESVNWVAIPAILSSMDLGILPSDQRKSVGACLRRGHARVTLPVVLIMTAGFAALAAAMILLPDAVIDSEFVFVCFLMPVPPLLAWVWWSREVSPWRIWALRTVDRWPSLERAAVLTGLIWPRGSIFEKTEIKSPEQRALEVELLRVRDRDG